MTQLASCATYDFGHVSLLISTPKNTSTGIGPEHSIFDNLTKRGGFARNKLVHNEQTHE